MTDHTDLIARLKAATEPSDELDADIAEALGMFEGMRREGNIFWEEFEEFAGRIEHRSPPYLSSLDAALSTARTRLEQWVMLRAVRVECARGCGSVPPAPFFDLCRAAMLVRLESDAPQIGRGWKISDATQKEIAEIEKSIVRRGGE